MPEHPAAAVQHNARMVPGPPSTGVAIAMDGGTLISLNPLRGSPLRLFVLLVLKHLEVYIRCVGFSEFVNVWIEYQRRESSGFGATLLVRKNPPGTARRTALARHSQECMRMSL